MCPTKAKSATASLMMSKHEIFVDFISSQTPKKELEINGIIYEQVHHLLI